MNIIMLAWLTCDTPISSCNYVPRRARTYNERADWILVSRLHLVEQPRRLLEEAFARPGPFYVE